MKNIHLVPTDKPSRLFKDDNQVLNLHTHPVLKGIFTNGIGSNQHIYITSSEEIKGGDWGCHVSITNDEYQIIKCNISNKTSIQEHWRKVILTTDPKLIADGVQSIDEEFLQWFVKNPRCEYVDITYDYFQINQDSLSRKGSTALVKQHKIIIPLEEPNPMHCDCGFLFEICKNRLCSNEFEEAAKKWVFETNGHKWSNNDNTAGDNYGSFVQGLKWKEERSYSYEEVILFLQKYRLDLSSNQTERWGDTTEHWFQKYKKR